MTSTDMAFGYLARQDPELKNVIGQPNAVTVELLKRMRAPAPLTRRRRLAKWMRKLARKFVHNPHKR
jgi:hypothetical protein